MQQEISEKFRLMDGLSQQGKPFLFLVDFELKNIEIFDEFEIKAKGLQIDFHAFKSYNGTPVEKPKFYWEAHPEPLEKYRQGFDLIMQNLRAGNSYLANYTCRTEVFTNLTLEQIFRFSKAKYKLYYPGKFVFFSPETFVEIEENKISTYPMKGTADASPENAEITLKENRKEKAEHHTVTDLLRNDLSIVANDIIVEEFAKTELIKTAQKNLYAMSSKVSGKIKPGFQGKIGSILQKILPAGSILGAPKPRTMEIVKRAENYSRGWYTGVCGYFDGESLDSCVMIRFIEEENGKLFFKSGGGITHQSILEEEYQEMINKIYVPIF